MSSLKAVAERAEVSLMTVSRYLNHPEKVAPKTRERVKEAIEALNYEPYIYDKLRRQGYKKSIGILSINSSTTPFSVDILRAIEKTIRQYHWHSFVVNAFEDENDIAEATDYLCSHYPAGVIICRNGLEKIDVPESLHHFPIVLANCLTDDLPVASYIPNDYQAQFDLTTYLKSQGYKNALCLYIPKTAFAAPFRQRGFREAWAGEYEEFFMQGSVHSYDNGAEALEKILNSGENFPFDVVICGNDRIAFLAYQLLLSHGYKIPEDVAVVGFDNMVGVTHLFRPPLTTVQLPHYEMGRQATLHFIENRQHKEIKRLFCPLVFGESC